MTPERAELTGWSQIAEYLGVSVRTAQVYEREQGLPVHRLPGQKGRVWASTDELDTWKLNTRVPSTGHEADFAAPTVPTQPTPLLAAISRRQVLLPVLASSGALLLGAAYGLARSGLLKSRPVDWRVTGNTLTVLGDNGRELWHHAFPAQMDLGIYQKLPGHSTCIFADLDGDGNLETIFLYYPLAQMTDERKIVCFNANGKIRWEFLTARTIVDSQSREWIPPYIPSAFLVISPQSGPARVVVTSVHYWSFPSQVAVLDASGKLVGEFWHRGHLTHIGVADLYGTGRPHVLLGGVNDAPEYKKATLLSFDPNNVSGGSCLPAGEPYFQGVGPGTQTTEMFFPRTPASLDQEFNRVQAIMVASRRITVLVAEGISEDSANQVIYDLDFHLDVISAFLSDPLKARYHEMEATGLIHKGAAEVEGERLRSQVAILRRSG